jgi:hypothetical protein
VIDLLGSEYGWKAEDIMDTPIDQIAQLVHAIMHRRGVRVFRSHIEREKDAPSLADRMKSIFTQADIDTEVLV